MLEWAVAKYCEDTVASLCSLPSAREVDASTWVSLMTRSLETAAKEKTAVLCSMPAAATISPADVIAVIKAALQHKHTASLVVLCQLPAARQIPPGDIPGLVQLAEPKQFESGYAYLRKRKEEKCVSDTLQLLASLDTVRDMSAADLFKVIKTQLQLGYRDEAALRVWYKCQTAHSMPADVLAQRMQRLYSSGIMLCCEHCVNSQLQDRL